MLPAQAGASSAQLGQALTIPPFEAGNGIGQLLAVGTPARPCPLRIADGRLSGRACRLVFRRVELGDLPVEIAEGGLGADGMLDPAAGLGAVETGVRCCRRCQQQAQDRPDTRDVHVFSRMGLSGAARCRRRSILASRPSRKAATDARGSGRMQILAPSSATGPAVTCTGTTVSCPHCIDLARFARSGSGVRHGLVSAHPLGSPGHGRWRAYRPARRSRLPFLTDPGAGAGSARLSADRARANRTGSGWPECRRGAGERIKKGERDRSRHSPRSDPNEARHRQPESAGDGTDSRQPLRYRL